MGVTIYAVRKVQWIEDHNPEPFSGECDDHYCAYTYTAHEGSFAGIPILHRDGQFIIGPCYDTPYSEQFEIMSRSYLGYSAWRRDFSLAVQGRAPEAVWEDPTGPGWELIHFADNEGHIGPTASASLLEVFESEEHRARYLERADPGVGWLADMHAEAWDNWRKGLEMAADGGLVRFA